MTMNKMIIKLDNANKDIRRHEDEIRRLGQSSNKTKLVGQYSYPEYIFRPGMCPNGPWSPIDSTSD